MHTLAGTWQQEMYKGGEGLGNTATGSTGPNLGPHSMFCQPSTPPFYTPSTIPEPTNIPLRILVAGLGNLDQHANHGSTFRGRCQALAVRNIKS